jgi:amidase
LGIQAQANDGLLLQLAVQIERVLRGKWNGGLRSEMHVAQAVQVA